MTAPEMLDRMVRANHWSFVVMFVAGGTLLILYGLAEVLAAQGIMLGDCVGRRAFPWGLVLISGLLIAPATVGAARAYRLVSKGLDVADDVIKRGRG